MPELKDAIRDLSDSLRSLAKEVSINTTQIVKLKTEVRQTRQVEEKNVAFLQEMLKDMIDNRQEGEKNKWETTKILLNWGLKIAGILILAFLALRGVIPS